jgi:hypothetical protein
MDEHAPGPEEVRLAARLCCEALLPVADRDWSIRAGDLEWSARDTLEHAASTQIVYAVRLATRARERPPVPRCFDPDTTIRDLLVILESRAAVLAEVVKAAPPEARGFHQTGFADASGFAAMGCDEVLIHTDDIACAFGLSFSPPASLCQRVVRRLFPWAPDDGDAWPVLRWANGRMALPRHERLGEDWPWHSAPLSEWDGIMPTGEPPSP